ncbi:MAG: Fic family protein [Anaerolineae bacterium]|nr:Fic family protein [Anaerolineae bacterium]
MQIWNPRYTLAPALVRALMKIEAAKAIVEQLPLPPAAEAELRRRARLRSTHYSTRIEGNRLTLAETEQVIEAGRTIKGRERDVSEVKHYWDALLWVESQAMRRTPLTDELVRKLHALTEHGQHRRPSPYRDGQNVIRDSITRDIVYLPPEAKDVPALMKALVRWVAQAESEGLLVPIVAGLAHYQFVTLHPYYDGNGRTARLLATFILQRGGYGLNGILSIEEQHARDLERYYAALVTHPHHSYYEGRADADLTAWLNYFLHDLERVFTLAKEEAAQSVTQSALSGFPQRHEAMHTSSLDARAQLVRGLFARQERITSQDVAATLGLSTRMARVLLAEWVAAGWLHVADPSKRNRAYVLR